MFNGGVRPAVDVGLSVSRVGGSAQIKAMKKIAGKLRLDLAQFRELEAFAKFASDLDESTAAQITRGRRMVEILKQNQYVPMTTEKQVAIIYAASQGYLDDIELESVKEFEVGLLEHFESKHSECLKEINSSGDISDDLGEKMNKAIEEFKRASNMANLKNLSERIKSVTSIQQVTKAMKMVAAAKVKKAQEKMEISRPYSKSTQDLICRILPQISVSDISLVEKRKVKNTGIIVITSDRGFAGSFNSSVIRLAEKEIEKIGKDSVQLFCLGKKASEYFSKRDFNVKKRTLIFGKT